jgi:hypothetical protein
LPLTHVPARFKAIEAAKDSAGYETTIYCDESQVVLWPEDEDINSDQETEFYVEWHDNISGDMIPAGFAVEEPVPLPRLSPCNEEPNTFAVTFNGMKSMPEDDHLYDFSNQQKIVLCERAFKGGSYDRRDPKQILLEGLLASRSPRFCCTYSAPRTVPHA